MDIFCLVIALLVTVALIATSIIKPSIKIFGLNVNLYWIIALFGALVLLLSNAVSWEEFGSSLISDSSINPLKILILFISMTMISIFLDEIGFFSKIANIVLAKSKDSQYKIFFSICVLTAFLTMFTSNDIIVLTLTPFLIFFCRNAKISPIPYLVSEFVTANTWSMMFVIGNPTNIYLAQSYNINFVSYFLTMAIPTLLAGIVEILILFWLFKKQLKQSICHEVEKLPKLNRFLTIYGLSILIICTIMLVISSYINIPMYLVSLCSLFCLLLGVSIYYLAKKEKPISLFQTFKRGPYELIPFVLSMFVIVLSLTKYGFTNTIHDFYGNHMSNIIYGFSSLITSNLVNNIPMSVLYSSIISGLNSNALNGAIYGSIIGSNIGAFLTPLGALAGIMWMQILKSHDVKYNFLDFIKYGVIIALPVSTVAILSLYLFI